MVDKKPDIKKEEEKSTTNSQTLGFSSPRLELKKTIQLKDKDGFDTNCKFYNRTQIYNITEPCDRKS